MKNLWRDRRVVGSLVITLVLLLLMVWTSDSGRPYGRLERFWVELTAPLGRVLDDFGERTGGTVEYLLKYPTLVEENVELRGRLTELETLEADLEFLERENRYLVDLLELEGRMPVDTIPASVYSRSPGNWTREVMIDRGSVHGVAFGDVVVAPGGLVGRVLSTTAQTARVMLITSSDSGLGVQVASSGDAGVAEGQLLFEGRIRVTMFSPDARVSRGDLLVTSEFGEAYPAGIPVGRVLGVEIDESGLIREVWLTPTADMDRLSTILVLEGPIRGRINWSEISGAFESDEPPSREGDSP